MVANPKQYPWMRGEVAEVIVLGEVAQCPWCKKSIIWLRHAKERAKITPIDAQGSEMGVNGESVNVIAIYPEKGLYSILLPQEKLGFHRYWPSKLMHSSHLTTCSSPSYVKKWLQTRKDKAQIVEKHIVEK